MSVSAKFPAFGNGRHPWGNRWNKNRCNTSENGVGATTPVGKYSPAGDSPYGCADMAGNVWEWTWSLYGEDGREDLEAERSIRWVLRGGASIIKGGGPFSYRAWNPSCACRYWNVPYPRDDRWGFRVCVASQ